MRVGISPWQEEGNAFEITKDANVTPLFEEQHKHPLVSQAVCGLPKASRPPGNMPSRPSGPPRLPPPSCLPSLLGSLEPTAHSGHGPETRVQGRCCRGPPGSLRRKGGADGSPHSNPNCLLICSPRLHPRTPLTS